MSMNRQGKGEMGKLLPLIPLKTCISAGDFTSV
jgi:hypothetical protein